MNLVQLLSRFGVLPAGLAIAILAAGCTSVAPYRPVVDPKLVDAEQPPCERYERAANGSWNQVTLREQRRTERQDCYAQSVEHTAEYKLFFVEFDEQGRFFDRAQMEQLFQYLESMRELSRKAKAGLQTEACAQGGGGLSIVTFVHGWRHNARHDDSNVELARKVLRYTYGGEMSKPHHNPADCPRQVLGIYVGWRGLSTTATDAAAGPLRTLLAPWELISVWDRKNTAQNVAVGSVRELFATVRAYQDMRNEDERDDCRTPKRKAAATAAGPGQSATPETLEKVYQCLAVRHLIVGHSYGALIVHNAVAQQLLENMARGRFETPMPVTSAQLDKSASEPASPGQERKPEDHTCLPGATSRSGGKSLVRGYADLIVLLNPAVEGARYEPLYEAVAQRGRTWPGLMGGFCANQKPVMVVLTSEYDVPTRWIFRGVRAINTVFESTSPFHPDHSDPLRAYVAQEEGRSSLRTLGHNERYNTHEVVGWDKFIEEQPKAEAERGRQRAQAESARLEAERFGNQPPRTERAQRAFLTKEQLDAEVRMRREQRVQALRDTCRPAGPDSKPAAADALQCMEADARERETNRRKSEREACTYAALVDRNLAAMLAPGVDGKGYGNPGWSAGLMGGAVLSHLPYYLSDYNKPAHEELIGKGNLPEYHSPHAPIWNVMVRDASIMNGHNDIAGDAAVALMAQLYRAVALSSFAPDVVRELGGIAEKELLKCGELPS